MKDHALNLASSGFEVFPLNGKVPAIPGGRGCLDATTDVGKIEAWWTSRPNANIGLRIPPGQVVVDIDPRHKGHEGLELLEAVHGPLPVTRTAESGRGDGGRHFYFYAPDGPLTSSQLPAGMDLKTRGGYVVAPPSLHPDSGLPYRWLNIGDPVPLPEWFADLIVRRAIVTAYIAPPTSRIDSGSSIADEYQARATWTEILAPHGWHVVGSGGDQDGSRWRHPTATSPCSATIRNGCLFVYSSNTPFDVTESGDPHGYTKFRAYAILNHDGDLSAAGRYLRIGAR